LFDILNHKFNSKSNNKIAKNKNIVIF